MSSWAPWQLSIADLQRAYRARELSPVAVTQAYNSRIEALDGRLCSYVTVTPEAAAAAALASELRFRRGEELGPLDGVPIALKDLIDTAGVRTTAQSALYAERVPRVDATVVRQLAQAGVVFLGKLALHEFGIGSPELQGPFAPARNPWDLERMAGGSSSGSAAAVAAGLCAGALGSDTGGSIRVPSSYCGIVGVKPTFGVVSRFGVIPLSWTLDHVGPMTRTVGDARILLGVLKGFDPCDPASSPMNTSDLGTDPTSDVVGLRVGVPVSAIESAPDLHPETLSAFREAIALLEHLGAVIELIQLPEPKLVATVYLVIVAAEAFAFHEQHVRETPQLYGDIFYLRLLEGALLTAADYLQALRGRTLICKAMAEVMRSIDLLALPTTPHPAPDPVRDSATPWWQRTLFTPLFNLTGQPAISIPCGFSEDGLPIGLQLVGRRFADDGLLTVAQAYEDASGWSARLPVSNLC